MLLAQLNDALVAAGSFGLLNHFLGPSRLVILGVSTLVFALVLLTFRGLGLYESWRLASLQTELQKIIGGSLLVYLLLFALGYLRSSWMT